ncbi:MAG: FAD-dependent oxidoreductase [Phenylobacterium zucineum]|nr:MAG: FAD-dependent oxidoreductase [Phenylobacterium zucineum]
MAEKVVVIGAGIAGLCAALALAPTGRQVTLLERDPPPPTEDPNQVFADWSRRGVGHLRHSHAFLARLRLIIRDEHPKLLADLLAAGCRELGLEGMLSDIHRRTYKPEPIDSDFVILTSRRTTLELVIRNYAASLPGVVIRSACFVRDILTNPGTPISVRGVRLESGEELTCDLLVDAGGRTSNVVEQLLALGAPITETAENAGILYFTRHYRLKPGMTEPPRGKTPATGDLGFLKFGVFPGDEGCFSITLCVPEIEVEMRKAIVRPDTFDAICRQMPGLVPWIEPDRSEPVSKVFGMGDLQSRWRTLLHNGMPAALNVFPVGDSLVRTNPLYGRGCSFAAAGAYVLRDALRASPDPVRRLIAYESGVVRDLQPYFKSMLEQDRNAIRRARQALTPGHVPDLRSKVLKSFMEDGVGVAIRSDPDLLRAAMRGFHMLEHPSDWLKRPKNIAKILKYWARGKVANAEAYPPKPGPDRETLMRAVGISPDLDIERLRAA